MTLHSTRIPKTFRPRLSVLEERCTPTVNSLLVAGVAPGLNGCPSVSIGGVINDSISDAVNEGGLRAMYQISAQDGTVLASGPVELTPVSGFEHLSKFGITIPRSVGPGSVQVITLLATDSSYESGGDMEMLSIGSRIVVPDDGVGGYESASANLMIPRAKGISAIGFGAWDSDLGTYNGMGQGKLTIRQKPEGGLSVQGDGCLVLTSGSTNEVLVGAQASGKFCFAYDTAGNVRVNVKGKALVTARTNDNLVAATAIQARQTESRIPPYQAALTIKGELNLVRRSDSSLCVSARGDLGLKASGYFGRFCGTARDMVIGIKTDAVGNVKLAVSGKLNLKGNLQLGSVMPITG